MLQFRVSKLFGTMTKIHGMALPSPDGIRLAFKEPEDEERANRIDFDIQEVLVAWDNLDEIKIDRGLVGDQVTIRVKSFDALRNLPEFADHEVTLETRRQDRDVLEQFEREVNEFRAGRRQDNVDDMLDDIRDFLY